MKSLAFALLCCAISVRASPFPQAVTAAIPPPGGIRDGCSKEFDGEFGIAVIPMSSPKGPTTSHSPSHENHHTASQETSHEISLPEEHTMQQGSLSQIPDGQVQNPKTQSQSRSEPPATPFVSVITEKSTIVETNHISSIHDGQLQAPTGHGKTKTLTHTHLTTLTEKPSMSKRAFGYNRLDKQTASSNQQHSEGEPDMKVCATNSTLTLKLHDNILKDDHGRTGYVASNYQFQFDGPPQAGAMYTSGFSICDGDLLALGQSTTWYQCASGDFYNLYDRNWAPQCEPIQLQVVRLEKC